MAALREVRELLLHMFINEAIDEVEFLLLYELNLSRNPDFLYFSYARFQLDYMNDSECMAEFRFYRSKSTY